MADRRLVPTEDDHRAANGAASVTLAGLLPGEPRQVQLLKRFSYSDRIRYYRSDPEVTDALRRLLQNL